VNSRRPGDSGGLVCGTCLGGRSNTLQSNRFSPIALQSSVLAYAPSKCMGRANPFLPNPLANAGLTLWLIFPFLHQVQTRAPLRNTPLPRRLVPNSVIPTVVAGLFFRAVCGAPATRRDHGNQSALSQFNPSGTASRFLSHPPPIHFSYPPHSFFLLWKFLFPFDAAFPLALPLHC